MTWTDPHNTPMDGMNIEEDKKYCWKLKCPGCGVEADAMEEVRIICGDCNLPMRCRKKRPQVRKMVCPGCGNSVRATKVVHITCTDCQLPMEES